MAATADAVTISDEGLLLRGAGREPLVLTFDGRYIWAFSPARDGRPQGSGVLVEWPPVLRRFLYGRVRVRVSDVAGTRVLVDARSSSAARPARSGSRSSTPRACRWPWTRSATCAAPSRRRTTAYGPRSSPAPAGARRPARGLRGRGLPQLRRAARRHPRRRDDRPRLRHRRLLPEPALVAGRPDRRVLPDRADHEPPRLDAAADVGRRHQAAAPAERRPAVPHRRVRGLPRRRHLLPARQPQRPAR